MDRLLTLGTWSSGMIPASGAGGPGFNSRSTPNLFDLGRINYDDQTINNITKDKELLLKSNNYN